MTGVIVVVAVVPLQCRQLHRGIENLGQGSLQTRGTIGPHLAFLGGPGSIGGLVLNMGQQAPAEVPGSSP